MKQEEFKEEIKKKIEDISEKINELKSHTPEDSSLEGEISKLVNQMEKIRDDIQNKYDRAGKSVEHNWDKITRNIYQDLESFDNAFKKAGSLFKSRRKK